MPAEELETAMARGAALDLDQVIAEILAEGPLERDRADVPSKTSR
jgi:hypothetical protein